MVREEEQSSTLEKAILKTLAFFDIFEYPLTLVELYKWLYLPNSSEKYNLFDIYSELEIITSKNNISSKNGFYFLLGRSEIIKTRLYRYQLAEKKFKIALKTALILKWLSPIKMVSICNNVGYNNGTERSDIDFFIIVEKNRLWLSRFFVTIITNLLGVRRHDQKFIDRICLSFYIANDHLDISDISLKPNDIYLVFWLATLAPIYDDGIYRDFFEENKWVYDFLPNFYPTLLNGRRQTANIKSFFSSKKLNRNIFKRAGDIMEKTARLIQAKKVNKYFGQASGDLGSNVVISYSMFKFHKTDRREFYRQEWEKKLKQLNIYI